MKRIYFFLLCLAALASCAHKSTDKTEAVLRQWMNKEVILPQDPIYTILWKDTVDYPLTADYRVLTYVDTAGCMSCRMRLTDWKKVIHQFDSVLGQRVQFLFYFSPKRNKLIFHELKASDFTYPVCIDETDQIGRLNTFPEGDNYHTFLLDNQNRILAIGNPTQNPKMQQLFLDIIAGKEAAPANAAAPQTTANAEKTVIDLGKFDSREQQKVTFSIRNTGEHPLMIDHVETSCECTTARYSDKPVSPGSTLTIEVTYTPDGPEPFTRDISVYCNIPSSPLELTITGEAL